MKYRLQSLQSDPQRVRALEERVAGLIRVQDANRERAMQRGLPYEAVPFSMFEVLRAVGEPPRLTRAELSARLVEDGLAEAEARRAIVVAERIGLVREGPDRKFWLAGSARRPG